jgi:hypothetical protein
MMTLNRLVVFLVCLTGCAAAVRRPTSMNADLESLDSFDNPQHQIRALGPTYTASFETPRHCVEGITCVKGPFEDTDASGERH